MSFLPRSWISWRKLQWSPPAHCPLDSHCQQSPRILCTRVSVPSFLTKISNSVPKILISNFLLDTSFHHRFQSVLIRSFFLLMNLQVIQFQHGLESLRLSVREIRALPHIYHVGDDSQHSSATMLRVRFRVQVSGHVWDDQRLSLRYQALWSPPVTVFSTVGVRTACRVRLRVRAREVEPPTAS